MFCLGLSEDKTHLCNCLHCRPPEAVLCKESYYRNILAHCKGTDILKVTSHLYHIPCHHQEYFI
jgi:hypothetical protein